MTKKERVAAMITGSILYLVAALFSVALILGALGFASESGVDLLFRFGRMLISVYGLCSVLIPIFFFAAGSFCLSAKWSVQRAFILLVSAIPFFTLATSERISREILKSDSSPIGIVKVITLVSIALLLVALEYLLAVTLASFIKKMSSSRLSVKKIKVKPTFIKSIISKKFNFSSLEKNSIPQQEKENKDDIPEDELSFDVPKIKKRGVWSIDSEGNIKGQNEKFEKDEREIATTFDDEKNEIDVFDAENEGEEGSFDFADDNTIEKLEKDSYEILDEEEKDDNFLTHDTLDPDEENLTEDEDNEGDDSFDILDEDNIENEEDFFDDRESEEEPFEVYEGDDTENENPSDFEEETEPDITFTSQDNNENNTNSLEEKRDIVSENHTTKPFDSIEYNKGTVANPDGLKSVFSKMDADARRQVENRGIEEENSSPIAVTTTEDGKTIPIKLPPKKKKNGPYKISTELLTEYDENKYWIIDNETEQAAKNLKETLSEFKIDAEVTGIRKGPVVTMFELLPAPGVKLSRIQGLSDNIALRLAASSVRIVAPIPGKRAVGIEVPNKNRAIVSFRECIEQQRSEWKKMEIPVVLGKDIQGETQIMDLVKTPHLLIAGATGAGKSVCVNSMILSILYKRNPNDVKMILIDPKIVELKLYNGIPHLLTQVITEPKKAMQALQYCLSEMERRYAVLDSMACRDITSYNRKIVEQHIATEKLPYLVVIIDEFADLMATTGKALEGLVARLAAMSRAVGIHLVLATQRPSVDVITGLIKANVPSRIAFMVAAKMDSRIIIDQVGAEKLLGKGDMLYASTSDPFPVRIQGALVSDTEVENVVAKVKEWGEPEYIDDEIFVDSDEDDSEQIPLFGEGGEDPLYEKALEIVMQAGKASASYIQRRLSIGYNRAARLVEEMEERGIVGPANGSKPREVIHVP